MNHCSINHLQWRISLSGEQLIKTFLLYWFGYHNRKSMTCIVLKSIHILLETLLNSLCYSSCWFACRREPQGLLEHFVVKMI